MAAMHNSTEDAEYMPSLLFGGGREKQMPTYRPATPDVKQIQAGTPGMDRVKPSPWDTYTNTSCEIMDAQYLRKRNSTPNANGPPTASFLNKSSMMDAGVFGMQRTPVPNKRVPSKQHVFQEVGEEYWITVFGFQMHQVGKVLNLCRQYGEIVNYKTHSGNYMHVLYRTKMQAQLAMSKNGQQLLDNAIIGVVPCTNPDAGGNQSKNNSMQEEDDGDILAPPVVKNDICTKVMQMLGF